MRHIAIIGSGPAGYYTAEAAQKQWGEDVRVDIFDMLPVPYGLIRTGVAPDHQSIKGVSRRYEGTALSDNVRFVGNVTVGRDVSIEELQSLYDAVVLATPEIAGLPYVVAGLVAAGGLAAALSTADGLLLTISNALSHDVYYKMVNPNATAKKRLTVARVLLLGVAAIAAYAASNAPATILSIVAWAFSIAAAAFFPALVLGIFWKRANRAGAVAGMLVGFGLTLYYLINVKFLGMTPWFGIKDVSAGIFGIPLSVSAAYVMIFVLFGAFVERSGAGQLFMDFALSITGHTAPPIHTSAPSRCSCTRPARPNAAPCAAM